MRAAVAAGSPAGRALGARAVATYAFRTKEALLRELVADAADVALPSQRHATASVARRQQWATVPLDAPLSLTAAMAEPCEQARIITEAQWPHRVVFANAAWERVCGWPATEVVDRHGLSWMQGDETDPAVVRRINDAVKHGERVQVSLVNYKRDGTPFINSLSIAPLFSAPGAYTHMLGIVREIRAPAAPASLQVQHRLAQQAQQQRAARHAPRGERQPELDLEPLVARQ